jgi:hypothetical protein
MCIWTNFIYSHDATPEIWQETYVSALLRAIIYSDDATYWLDAYRKLDPITSREGELRFLQAAAALFFKGPHAVLPVISCIVLMDGSRLAGWL